MTAMATSMVWSAIFEDSDWRAMASSALFLFLSVAVIASMTFVSIVVWTEARRKEREAYYKAETVRRVAEAPGEGGRFVIEMMREEERIRHDREREENIKKQFGLKVGGLVTIGVGAGLMIFLYAMHPGQPGEEGHAYLVGLIPGLIGVALLASAYLFPPKP